MSSSPERSSRRAWSLRRKLLAQLVALFTVVCLFMGLVTELALNSFLVGQLDEQLISAVDRARAFSKPPPPSALPNDRDRRGDPLKAPGQGLGTLIAIVDDGQVINADRLAGPDAQREQLSPSDYGELLSVPADGVPHTRSLGDFGEYRLAAVSAESGNIVITGLPMADVDETLLRVGLIFGAVALGGLLITVFIGALTVRRTLRPLDRLAATASHVTELPLDKGEVALSVRVPVADTDTRTEVGKVGTALNQMIGHVASALDARQKSESRVRQFVADASHELRTPLTAIRGYAELIRHQGELVPDDVRFAMGRVEAEATRMTNLVEELLLLARLDAGRARTYEPVDLSRLVADAVSDAHVAGRQHRWVLDAPAEPIAVRGDAEQLHQVVLNLLSNARTHTPQGTTVQVVLSQSGQFAVLRVRDNGPGIPAAQLPDVFERFARGDTSRSRLAGSTGLGLAIVAGVVAAHRGHVSVRSVPGDTEFTVTLPVSAE